MRVKARFKKDGTIEMKVEGVKGPSCKSVTEKIAKECGFEITGEELTEEYYEQNLQQQEEIRTHTP